MNKYALNFVVLSKLGKYWKYFSTIVITFLHEYTNKEQEHL